MNKHSLAVLASALISQAALADQLTFHTFNPQESSIFPVSSVIVEGDKEVLLVDAQFQRNDAQKLVQQIKAIGKPLKTVYISHYDPDFYFGLDVVGQAFPNAEIVATPETVAHIEQSIIGKYKYWSPILKNNAPKMLVLPKATDAAYLKVGSSRLEIRGKHINPALTYLWDSGSKTVLGGVPLYEGTHLWLADSQTKQARSKWARTLDDIAALKPRRVIPGHFIGTPSVKTIEFNRRYLAEVEKAVSSAKNSSDVVNRLKTTFPNLKGGDDLELGAKVVMGEEKWPK
ncbi:MAG: MBL fold metallo-hydrolase [Neisseria zoodegmatis]|uniref:MBL fold metallo-hydrolase n=1 Tax=Neisseria zoodegmatis TaxID=326523 RepID=UPI0026EC3506|nr:MBL fold metallo-hydrolase [Neisseria zoodegmatis]MDO5069793.1 MBL fold metallo-hydrolase [Neisseria zoodegmatis]